MNRNIARLAAACVLAAAGQASYANTLVYNLDRYFNGNPAVPAPITATFQDIAGGGVRLYIHANASLAGESIKGMGFNLDPAMDPTSLVFATPPSPPFATSISTGTNAYKADGDGFFDIRFIFRPNAFVSPLTGVYKITGIPGLNVSSFLHLSAPSSPPAYGPFYVAGNTSTGGSSWLTVTGTPTVTIAAPIPEPEIYAMMLAGLALMGFVARRRKRDLSAA
jgi:hypothetical protein